LVEYKTACCKTCLEFISDDGWTLGQDNKSDYCVIGQGGEIISCDTKQCKNSFTLDALRRWMGTEAVEELVENEDKPFHCFSCNTSLGSFKSFLEKTEHWTKLSEDYKQRVENANRKANQPKPKPKPKVSIQTSSDDDAEAAPVVVETKIVTKDLESSSDENEPPAKKAKETEPDTDDEKIFSDLLLFWQRRQRERADTALYFLMNNDDRYHDRYYTNFLYSLI